MTEVQGEDIIVETKKRLSVFYPTDLDFLLRNLDARVLVIDGAMTDCCVLNAAFEGSNLGYRIIVLQDLVRGTNEEMDGAALKMVSLHLGIVMDSADLLAVWRGTEPTPHLPPICQRVLGQSPARRTNPTFGDRECPAFMIRIRSESR